jgi:hypothetical protein
MERQYARTIAPNRHARENTRRDYFNGPFPRFRVDIHARCRLWVWRKSRAQKRLPDRRATTGMVKKHKRQRLRIFPFQPHRTPHSFLDCALRESDSALGRRAALEMALGAI